MSNLRQRAVNPQAPSAQANKSSSSSSSFSSSSSSSSSSSAVVDSSLRTAKDLIRDEESESTLLEMARWATFLSLLFVLFSYVITRGESLTFDSKSIARVTNLEWVKSFFTSDTDLTPSQLLEYSGEDPNKPIYLSINRTIYSVTPSRRIYGPGGSYHQFAGRDASMAYVTGCMSTPSHLTPSMAGAELMFLPLDDPETDAHFTDAELEELKAQELQKARKEVYDALKHWVDFFAKNEKYVRVGRLIMPTGWELEERRKVEQGKGPDEWCHAALDKRTKRKIPKDKLAKIKHAGKSAEEMREEL